MLVLCSNGLSSKEMRSYMQDKVRFCKTAALVVTADNEYKESNYHVLRCISEFEETCCIYEKEHNVNVIRINDGEGVFISETIYVCKV